MVHLGELQKGEQLGKRSHWDNEEKARKRSRHEATSPEEFSHIGACVGQDARAEARGIARCQGAAGVLDVVMKTMDWKLQEVVVDALSAKLEVKGEKFVVSRKELQGTKQVMKKLQQDFISFSGFLHHVERQGENFDKTGIEGSRHGFQHYLSKIKEMLALKPPEMIKLSVADYTLKLQLTSEIERFLEEENGRSTTLVWPPCLRGKCPVAAFTVYQGVIPRFPMSSEGGGRAKVGSQLQGRKQTLANFSLAWHKFINLFLIGMTLGTPIAVLVPNTDQRERGRRDDSDENSMQADVYKLYKKFQETVTRDRQEELVVVMIPASFLECQFLPLAKLHHALKDSMKTFDYLRLLEQLKMVLSKSLRELEDLECLWELDSERHSRVWHGSKSDVEIANTHMLCSRARHVLPNYTRIVAYTSYNEIHQTRRFVPGSPMDLALLGHYDKFNVSTSGAT
ncbi:hypothetical protein SELMODRAFT_413952 [Selaginella moellendorffii]|uniref:Uncharacterized protein n=1 Tax=Selaginella moellendorffii TaxID=88036 RepID=D8RR57_SELML|nr:hypothetical protein SELMODRAFT_413952 [Selaginella moellendorffii]